MIKVAHNVFISARKYLMFKKKCFILDCHCPSTHKYLPMWSGSSCIVKDFPDPVCPYASTVELYLANSLVKGTVSTLALQPDSKFWKYPRDIKIQNKNLSLVLIYFHSSIFPFSSGTCTCLLVEIWHYISCNLKFHLA